MPARAIHLKPIILFFLIIVPFLLYSCLNITSASETKLPKNDDTAFFSKKPVLRAGGFSYFDVALSKNKNIEKIKIILYNGRSIPKKEARSVLNYYEWEYDHGVWKDNSGYTNKYIDSSKCYRKNNTFYFYIGIDKNIKPGRWHIKIIIQNDEKKDEECYDTSVFIIISFNCFFSTFFGVFEPSYPLHREYKNFNKLVTVHSNRKKTPSYGSVATL